jgi:NAD+ kinase
MPRQECDWTGLVVKGDSWIALETAEKIIDEAKKLGEELRIPDEWGIESEKKAFKKLKRFSLIGDRPCRIIVIGGDGTLLKLLQYPAAEDAIIMTIGAGRRCYFFDIDNTEVQGALTRLLEKDYIEHRMWRLRINACNEYSAKALNEIAILGDNTRITRMTVIMGFRKVFEVVGDGLIVSTTQGSTAYSLSAGGPIVDPLLLSMIITPVNPVALNIRPIVVEPFSEIRVRIPQGEKRLRLLVDGIGFGGIPEKCEVKIRLDEKPVRVARTRWVRFYERLFPSS